MDEEVKILLIDDNENDYLITSRLISGIPHRRYAMEWVSDLDKAVEAISRKPYDVLLVDYRLGMMTGLEVIDEVQKITRDIPFIMLTGMEGYDIDVLSMKKGASDFLRKDKIDGERLERSIRYSLEKKKSEMQIAYLAYYDQLTSLPNRIFFKEQLNFSLSHAIRYGRMLAVLYLDLDNFKYVNDSLGHHCGDLLLKEVAKRLHSSVRKSDIIARNDMQTVVDTVARMGGDEFTISLTEIHTYEDTSIVSSRIMENLGKSFLIDGHEVFTGVSIGIALYPADARDSEALLKCADAAMYDAKKQGKNCYQFYTKSMQDEILDKIHLYNDIQKAGERDEFLLHYQPQMDLVSGKLTGLEALIRWNSAQRGLVQPMGFIPFAETHHLAGFIMDWVIQDVCRQLCEWALPDLQLLPISINVPVNQIKKPDFAEHVMKIIGSYGLRAELFVLEVTESIFTDDMSIINSKLGELRSLGFHLAIDDFGTGFSSLNRLRQIPCNTLKIGKSFIQCMNDRPTDAAIVGSIVSLAHGLKMRVLAEGVDTAEQFDSLRRLHCDNIQGNLLNPPLPKEKLPEILKNEALGEGIGTRLLREMNGG